MIPSNQTIEDKLKEYFKPPFTFGSGYIFDSNNQMVGEVRAWGYLQYKPDSEKLQDRLGELIAEALTEKFKTL